MASKFKDSNAYIILFSTIMVVVCGVLLAGLSSFLKPTIKLNEKADKKINILATIGVESSFSDVKDVESKFDQYVKQIIAVNQNGEVVVEGDEAFAIDLAKEVKKDPAEQQLPVFIAEKEGKKYYIMALRGSGLWGPIWGYMSISEDKTVAGASFGHASETPGLGAKIKDDPSFYNDFIGEKAVDASNTIVGVKVVKGNNDPENSDKSDNEIDAISGATITSDGVSNMIQERLSMYNAYLVKNLK